MTLRSVVKSVLAAAVSATIVFAAISVKAPRAHADDDDTNAKVQIGFAIAPVPLNLTGKKRALVGYGSYLVNAIGDCNGCHNSGGIPNFEYAPGGNPYFSQSKKVDPTKYLAGG